MTSPTASAVRATSNLRGRIIATVLAFLDQVAETNARSKSYPALWPLKAAKNKKMPQAAAGFSPRGRLTI